MRRSLLLALILCACGSVEFEAAVFLTIKPAADDGGWHVDMRAADGASIEGFRRRWVAAKSGVEPTVNLLVTRPTSIPGQTLRAELHVVRRAAENAPALAQGAAVVELEKGEEIEATVELTADPRPLAGFALMRLESTADGGSAYLDARTVAAVAGWELNLWLIDPDSRWHWIGRPANGSEGWFVGPAGGPLVTRFVGATLSVEPAGVPAPMALSLGWKGYRGLYSTDLLAGLRKALFAASDTPDGMGYLANFEMSYGHAVAHADLAVQSAATSPAESRIHCEHVYNAVAGAGTEVDLTGDGSKDFPEAPWPRTAVAGPQGYAKKALDAVLAPAESAAVAFPDLSPYVGQALACESSTSAATRAVLDAASDAGVAHSVLKVQRMRDLLDDLADGMSDGTIPTYRCLRQNIERLATVKLAPVAKSTD